MISQNDRYDMTYAFSVIRSQIRCENNGEILTKIISALNEDEPYEENQIRKALATIQGLDRERWNDVYHHNVYVRHKLLKQKSVYRLLVKLCEELQNLLSAGLFERAYDFIDSYHCLPDILADHHFQIPKSYWKIYVQPYRKKWDRTFLVQEEKEMHPLSKCRLLQKKRVV